MSSPCSAVFKDINSVMATVLMMRTIYLASEMKKHLHMLQSREKKHWQKEGSRTLVP